MAQWIIKGNKTVIKEQIYLDDREERVMRKRGREGTSITGTIIDLKRLNNIKTRN